MSIRPHKRPRIEHNPFIDVEAIVGNSEEEEDDDGMFEGDVDKDEELWEFQWNCMHLHIDTTSDDECIWEVGCKPGREMLVASRMFLDQQQKVPVMAYPSMPGWIFMQAPTRDVVSHLAESMDDLNSNVILPVPIENLHCIISVPAPNIKPQSWACVHGNILVSPTKVQAIHGCTHLSVNNTGSLVYRQHLYSAQGFLILKPSHADIVLGDNVLPSQTEFACFVESSLLDAATNASTRASLSHNNLVIGDHVKITSGDFRDLLGHIADILDDEYVIWFPSLDLVEAVPCQIVRAHYHVGDEVKIVSGVNSGLVGWVVHCVFGVGESQVTVVNQTVNLEVTMQCKVGLKRSE
ncbi:hypothetical protein CPB84DRAFT_1914205 [Gymnopilus junonius]|uniref:Chromatin elongation factor SPT5 n=1 Tax=Gymnopilus junonius TaxID=109634 RepID=A0A9P5NPR6_GYMJU|nr:hypothetical protein CPB84DRAFT_1914205 [Gymnopilus junonius]